MLAAARVGPSCTAGEQGPEVVRVLLAAARVVAALAGVAAVVLETVAGVEEQQAVGLA